MSSLKRAAARKPAARPAAKRAPRAATTPKQAVADLSADARRLAAAIDRALAQGQWEALSPEALQALMAALCKTYSARIESGERILPLAGRTAISATDAMHTASGLLKGADLQVFELGMWQSWTGR
jgi:hypothetical protein